MDFIIEEDAKLQWVRYSKRTNSVVIRVLISAEVIEQFLLRLARVVGIPLEVTIVEEKIGEKLIHEAFLFSVEVSSGTYPVFVLLYYNVSKFYPDRIVVGTLADAPRSSWTPCSQGRLASSDSWTLRRPKVPWKTGCF